MLVGGVACWWVVLVGGVVGGVLVGGVLVCGRWCGGSNELHCRIGQHTNLAHRSHHICQTSTSDLVRKTKSYIYV